MSWYTVDGYSPHSMRSGCLTCGNGDVRHNGARFELIISSGIEDEFAGVPEFCETCIAEVARMIGFVSGSEFAALKEAHAAALEDLAEAHTNLTEKSAALRSVVRELADAETVPETTQPKVKAGR